MNDKSHGVGVPSDMPYPEYRVACSACGADVLKACKTTDGRWVRPHAVREKAYESQFKLYLASVRTT